MNTLDLEVVFKKFSSHKNTQIVRLWVIQSFIVCELFYCSIATRKDTSCLFSVHFCQSVYSSYVCLFVCLSVYLSVIFLPVLDPQSNMANRDIGSSDFWHAGAS